MSVTDDDLQHAVVYDLFFGARMRSRTSAERGGSPMSSSNEILLALRRFEDSLSERLTAVMDRRFGELRVEMNARFDAIEARLESLETRQMIAGLRRIDERLAGHDANAPSCAPHSPTSTCAWRN